MTTKVRSYKKGLREPFSAEQFKEMMGLVEKEFGPAGQYDISNLHNFYNAQNDIIGCREWTKTVEIMVAAQKNCEPTISGYTFTELGVPLLSKIKSASIDISELVPPEVMNVREICYFALAVTEFRKKNTRPIVVSVKNRYGL